MPGSETSGETQQTAADGIFPGGEPRPSRPRRGLALMLLGLSSLGCSDDEHKGDVSRGPAATATASAETQDRVRLSYDTGSFVAAAGVAKRFRRRLEAAGVDADVDVASAEVRVDLAADAAERAKEALTGGRLDLWLAASADPFAAADETPFSVVEVGGRHQLQAPTERRAALAAWATDHAAGAKVIVGTVHGAETVRTWLVQPGRSVRGQLADDARATSRKGGVALEVTMTARGKSFVRWHSKQKERFVLHVEDSITSVSPAEEVKDGTLSFPLAGWDLEEAQKLAALVDGRALSHEVTLKSEGRREP